MVFSPVQPARSGNLECLSMDVWNVILRTASVVLSSFGILLSLLAIFIQTLVPSSFLSSKTAVNPSRPARRFKRSISDPVTSSSQSTKSNNIMHSSMVDGVVPRRHNDPASPVPATELRTQQSNRVQVAHKIFKRHTFSVSSSFNACRKIASPNQSTPRLKGRNSTGSFFRPLKNPNHTSDPPLRTQPYAAPYFFPAPGTPEAIDYVTKTREELLRPSGFIHMHGFTRKRNKKSSQG